MSFIIPFISIKGSGVKWKSTKKMQPLHSGWWTFAIVHHMRGEGLKIPTLNKGCHGSKISPQTRGILLVLSIIPRALCLTSRLESYLHDFTFVVSLYLGGMCRVSFIFYPSLALFVDWWNDWLIDLFIIYYLFIFVLLNAICEEKTNLICHVQQHQTHPPSKITTILASHDEENWTNTNVLWCYIVSFFWNQSVIHVISQ